MTGCGFDSMARCKAASAGSSIETPNAFSILAPFLKAGPHAHLGVPTERAA
jgi:hypothetical protein